MEILGIGPSEFVFVLIIALIVLGPKDMQKAGRTIGKFLRDVVTSDAWKMFQQTSSELRTLPTRLMREANEDLNQIGNELNKTTQAVVNQSGNLNAPSRSQPMPTVLPDNQIMPPAPASKPDEGNQNINE